MFVSLRSGARFRSIYREGTRRRRGGVILHVGPSDSGRAEVGIVAGKKVGNAVERNRAKRRLRSAVSRIRLDPALAYIFVATSDVLDAPFTDLVGWVDDAVADAAVSGGR